MTIRPALAAALLVVLAGCGSPSSPTSPAPTATPSPAPSGAATLRDLGIAHGPDTFWMPSSALIDRIDEPNVVTLTFATGDGTRIATWLGRHLSSMGFTTDAARGTSLVFHDAAWRGSYTCSATLCALTLRQQAS